MELQLKEISKPGRTAYSLPNLDVPEEKMEDLVPGRLLSDEKPDLPELSEVDVVRHFTDLSRRNFGVDSGFYPLGSCTMKYNPKINEDVSALTGFTEINPLQTEADVQGMLELLFNFEKYLCAIFGYDAATLQPAAGAHGELTSLFIIKAYHLARGDGKRNKVIVPDSSHGTNPASVSMVGWQAVQVRSNDRGGVDIEELKKVVGPDTAALMLTNPNTLGLFDENILEISDIVHKAGGQLYYDGANANATLIKVTPADLGFDIAHFNLHKTFATPHGGGGPGSGPVCVKKHLEPFLPVPRIIKDGSGCRMSDAEHPKSIGRVHSFYGNVNVIVKAYAYITSLGVEGLKEVSENAVLNANYVLNRLKPYYHLPYDKVCQHEFVISAELQKEKFGVKALDIAKRLIDYGFHPPTIYFPLIVHEALMIEPTETESKETLDKFCDAMIHIAKECETDPDLVKRAPYSTPVSKLDETKAAREPRLHW
ncbi:MAG: aminomethyl-transferring glycine dehydrogenase subunit GcvPB [bacterium]